MRVQTKAAVSEGSDLLGSLSRKQVSDRHPERKCRYAGRSSLAGLCHDFLQWNLTLFLILIHAH